MDEKGGPGESMGGINEGAKGNGGGWEGPKRRAHLLCQALVHYFWGSFLNVAKKMAIRTQYYQN